MMGITDEWTNGKLGFPPALPCTPKVFRVIFVFFIGCEFVEGANFDTL